MKTTIQNNKKLEPINADIFDNITRIHSINDSVHILIPNICGCGDEIISGFSKELYTRYPVVEINLQTTSNRKPGRVSFVDVLVNKKNKSKIFVANMCCQLPYQKSKRSIHYGQLVYSMYEVKRHLIELSKQNPDFAIEIHSPKIGSGVVGANWNFVSELFNDIWGDFKILVYNHIIEK